MPQGSRSSRPLSEKFLRKSVLFSFIVKRISLPPRGKEIRSASPRHALFESPDSLKRYFSNLGPDALPLPRALRGKIPLNFPP